MMKRILLCITIMLCWHSWSYAERPMQFFLEGAFHQASIGGTAQWSDAVVFGTEVDLDGDFGLDSVNAFTGKAGVVFYGRHELLFDYQHYSLSKEPTLSATIRFGGIAIPANLPVSSSLTFQTIGFFYGFRLINMQSGFLSLRPGFKLVDYDLGLKTSVFGFELDAREYSGSYTIPFLQVAGELKLHPMISLTGQLSGGYLGEQIAYFARPAIKVSPLPYLSAFVGYSHVWFKDDKGDNLFEITLSGLTAGLEVVF
jgi:hypothetical protein